MAAEERTPHEEPQGGVINGNGRSAHDNVPPIVKELAAFNSMTPTDLARLALQGETTDEIVPTAEGSPCSRANALRIIEHPAIRSPCSKCALSGSAERNHLLGTDGAGGARSGSVYARR